MPRLSEATQAIGQPDVSATQVIGKQVTSQSDASATQVIAPVDDAETSVLSDALPNVGEHAGDADRHAGNAAIHAVNTNAAGPERMESSGSADASRPDHQTRVATHRHAAATVRHTAGHGGRGAAIARNVIPAGTRYGWAERCGSTQSRRCEAWRDVGPGHAPLRADGDSRAVCGLFSLWTAMAAALLFACALATIGFNTEAQLEREANVAARRKVPTGCCDWRDCPGTS